MKRKFLLLIILLSVVTIILVIPINDGREVLDQFKLDQVELNQEELKKNNSYDKEKYDSYHKEEYDFYHKADFYNFFQIDTTQLIIYDSLIFTQQEKDSISQMVYNFREYDFFLKGDAVKDLDSNKLGEDIPLGNLYHLLPKTKRMEDFIHSIIVRYPTIDCVEYSPMDSLIVLRVIEENMSFTYWGQLFLSEYTWQYYHFHDIYHSFFSFDEINKVFISSDGYNMTGLPIYGDYNILISPTGYMKKEWYFEDVLYCDHFDLDYFSALEYYDYNIEMSKCLDSLAIVFSKNQQR